MSISKILDEQTGECERNARQYLLFIYFFFLFILSFSVVLGCFLANSFLTNLPVIELLALVFPILITSYSGNYTPKGKYFKLDEIMQNRGRILDKSKKMGTMQYKLGARTILPD
jgi:hypothetical protein